MYIMNKINYLKNKINQINHFLKGAYINKILEISNLDYLFIFSRSSAPSLLISLNSPNPFFSLLNNKIKTSLSSLFLQHLKNKLMNSCFIEASLYNDDSIIDFKFIKTTDTYDKIEYHLLFEVFKGNTNLILLNKDKIELAFRYHSLETSHPLILNTTYLPPKKIILNKEINEDEENKKEFQYIENLDSKYLKEKYNNLILQLKRKRKSLLNKKESLEKDLEKAKQNLKYKEYADYYLTILNEIKKGQSYFVYQDFKVPLKENYSVSDNLTYLYKIYKKGKSSIQIATKFLNETIDEIDYLDNILNLKDLYNENDYNDLLSELKNRNIIKIKTKNKIKESKASMPYFVMFNDFKIGYGKNNLQNNELTFKIARKKDLYLHIANNHGSHVVIFKNEREIDDQTISFALELVLYLAKKTDGTIYLAEIKDVKKGDSLGMANLLKYQTYFYKEHKFNIEEYLKKSERFN